MFKTVYAMSRRIVLVVVLIATALMLIWLLWPVGRKAPAHMPDLSFSAISMPSGPVTPIPGSVSGLDPRKIMLGKALFHDTALSQDNTIACSNCHQLTRGGADGMAHPLNIKGEISGLNTPTVFNSTLNFRQFWNGRARGLDDRAAGSVHNPMEMGANWAEVVARLKKNPVYVNAFSGVYRGGITPENTVDALVTYLRTLITPNSRFDKYLNGDETAISPYELSGFRLFSSYGCIACHQGVNLGGNVFEKLGVMLNYFGEKGRVTDADLGRYLITKNPDDMFVFKVPSLRNVALTAPYFHDGSALTLEAAVTVMGKYQLGVDIPEEEVARLVAFLRTLTGEFEGGPL
mgnify:CR=1 FL=1